MLVRDTEGETTHDLTLPRIKTTRTWLRMTKRGNSYQCNFSVNGKDDISLGKKEWGDGAPSRTGFLTKNGGNPNAPEIETVIDYFEYRSLASNKPQESPQKSTSL